MADIVDVYEKDLAEKSSVTINDYFRIVGLDNVSYKEQIAKLFTALGINFTNPKLLTASDNLNNVTAVGCYYTANTDLPANAPLTDAYNSLILVFHARDVDFIQLYFCNNKYLWWWRAKYGSNWRAWQQLPLKSEVDAVIAKTAVTVTASANVVIDTNKSWKCGKTLFLNVKGHTTANIQNASLFVFAGATVSPNAFTFGIPIGDSAWAINGIAYGYINANGVVGTMASGKYFHIAQAFLCE